MMNNNTVIYNIEDRVRYETALGQYMSHKILTYYSMQLIIKHMQVLHNCGPANTMRAIATFLDAGLIKYDSTHDAFIRSD